MGSLLTEESDLDLMSEKRLVLKFFWGVELSNPFLLEDIPVLKFFSHLATGPSTFVYS